MVAILMRCLCKNQQQTLLFQKNIVSLPLISCKKGTLLPLISCKNNTLLPLIYDKTLSKTLNR
jgi:hypothetical protein